MSAAPRERQRRDALRGLLRELDVPAALISTLVNVRYLTGFTGSNAALLVGVDGRDVFVTDGRYTDQWRQSFPTSSGSPVARPPRTCYGRQREVPVGSGAGDPHALRGRPGHRRQVVQRPYQEAG